MSDAARLLVWGSGGHGRVVADVARAAGWLVVGFVDRSEALLGTTPVLSGPQVVATESTLREIAASALALPSGAVAVALGVGDNRARYAALSWLPASYLATLVHPAATVSPSAFLGTGTVVMAGAVVNCQARIGAGVIVNTSAVVEHDADIGDGAHLSPGALVTGAVRIGCRAWVGAGAVVLPGCGIGTDSVVGAGAVVLDEVPSGVTVVGNPARLLPLAG